MRRTRTATQLAAASLLVILTACGGGGDSEAAAASGEAAAENGGSSDGLTVVATEFAYDPVDFQIAADQDVELTLENAGVVEHDITVDELDLEVYANAGETVTETVNLAAGTYEYYCSIPGHRSSGMEGTMTVS